MTTASTHHLPKRTPIVGLALAVGLAACDAEVPSGSETQHTGATQEDGDDGTGGAPGDECAPPDEAPLEPPSEPPATCDLDEVEQDARVVALAAAATELRAQVPFIHELPETCVPGAAPPVEAPAIYPAMLSAVYGLEEQASVLAPNDLVSVEATDLHVKRLELVRRSFERDIAAATCDGDALWAVECTKILTNQWVCIPTTDEDLQDLRAAEDCDCPWHWNGQCLCDKDHSTD